MKKLAFLVIALTSQIGPHSSIQDAVVFFYGFEIERITGLHESEIESYGSRCRVDRVEVERVLQEASPSAVGYNHLDVRAKIIIGDERYHIDYGGIFKLHDRSYVIDRDIFTELLTRSGGCSSAPGPLSGATK